MVRPEGNAVKPETEKEKSLSVAREGSAKDSTVLHDRFNVPMVLAFVVIEDPSPSHSKRKGKLPAMLFIVQPEAQQMPLASAIVLEGLSSMEDAHVVQETDVSLQHLRVDLATAADVVDRVQSLRLDLGEAGNARGSRIFGGPGQESTREVHQDFAILDVQEGALVEGRIPSVSDLG
jgi:hypothetical protein